MKNQATYLAMVSADLTNVIALVDAIRLEPQLQQRSLEDGIQAVLDRATLLETCVDEVKQKSKGGNLLRRFTYQLDKAPIEQKRLTEMMGNLADAKGTLFGLIQVVHVGISSRGSSTFVVNLNIVDQVNHKLQNVPGFENGLPMFEFLKERGLGNGGEVVLTKEDVDKLTKLGQETIDALDGPDGPQTLNMVVGNTAEPYSQQLPAQIGDGRTADLDAFQKVKHNIVIGNKAQKASVQIASPNSHRTLDKMLDQQLKLARILAGNPETGISDNHDKMEE
jgi:hypothetical protein